MRQLKPKKRKKYKRKPGPKKKKWAPPIPKYKIVLVSNKIKKNVFFTTDCKHEAILKFRDLREENIVDFPKRYSITNLTKTIPVKYEILFLKRNDKNSINNNRMVYNEEGNLVEEKVEKGKWIILDSAPYEVEESFKVLGFDPIYDRFSVRDIIKRLFFKDMSKNNVKTVYIMGTLVIIKDTGMDIIECKHTKDAIRLHNFLRTLTYKSKIKKFFFYGKLGIRKDHKAIVDEVEAKFKSSK